MLATIVTVTLQWQMLADAFSVPINVLQRGATRISGPTLEKQRMKLREHAHFSTKLPANLELQSVPTQTPDMEAFSAGFTTPTMEVGSEIVTVESGAILEGSIPSDLLGTYFKVGPAMFRAGSLPPPTNSLVQPKKDKNDNTSNQERFVAHPFDADGAIFAATFNSSDSHRGEVTYRYRYIRTVAFDRERKKGKKLYNAMEPTRTNGGKTRGNKVFNDYPLPMVRHHFMPGANKQRKNTSNTNVIYWANKLLSFWEGGLPYKLDGLALSTDGKSQLGGVLREETQLCSKTVHDANKNRMLLWSLQSEPSKSVLTTYEFNHTFKLVPGSQRDWKLPGYAILNDGIACTESWNVVIQPPVTVNGMQYLLSKDPAKCLEVDTNSPTLIHLIPRCSDKEMISISMAPDALGADFNSQCINAYQDGSEVVLDLIRSSGANTSPNSQQSTSKWPFVKTSEAYQSMASNKSLWRYRVDASARTVVSRECLSGSQLYLGSINPSKSGEKHSFIYAAIGGLGDEVAPPQGIAKIKCDTKEINVWMPASHEFCGQPTFTPRAKDESINKADVEDDGYLLTLIYNGLTKSSELVILNALNPSAGPIARVALSAIRGGIPHGNYGCFAPVNSSDAGWSSGEIERRAKLADKMELKGSRWNEVKSDFSGLGLRLDDWEEYFGDII